jgi:hypothetical protein
MKIFDSKEHEFWGEKVNFADDNNVMVGYDMSQSCCESADWFIADKVAEVMPKNPSQERELDGYQFDKKFFKEISDIKSEGSDWNALDEGGMVVFRLVNGDKEKFLHLYNCHNGYYGHGFEMKIGNSVLREGSL